MLHCPPEQNMRYDGLLVIIQLLARDLRIQDEEVDKMAAEMQSMRRLLKAHDSLKLDMQVKCAIQRILMQRCAIVLFHEKRRRLTTLMGS